MSPAAIDIESCTITANIATRFGTGIDANGGSLTIRNTILAGSTAGSSGPDCRTARHPQHPGPGVGARLPGRKF